MTTGCDGDIMMFVARVYDSKDVSFGHMRRVHRRIQLILAEEFDLDAFDLDEDEE